MTNELKPCPFCGSVDTRVFNDPDEYGRDSYGVQCGSGSCSICGPQRSSEEEAVAAWNTRQPYDWRDGAITEYGRDMQGMQNQLAASRELNAELVNALELGLEYWSHRQQRYKNRSPVWVEKARDAIAKGKAA